MANLRQQFCWQMKQMSLRHMCMTWRFWSCFLSDSRLDQECKFAFSFQKRSMFLIKIAKYYSIHARSIHISVVLCLLNFFFSYIVINKYTNVFASSPVQIPDEIQKLITKKTATEMDTSTVAVSPIKTTVSMRGIVAEVSRI